MYYLPHVRLFCGYVGRSVVWLVCRLIGLSWHNLRGGRCTSLLLLEHLQVLVRGSSGSFDRWHGIFDFLLMNQSWKSTSFNWLYIMHFQSLINAFGFLIYYFNLSSKCWLAAAAYVKSAACVAHSSGGGMKLSNVSTYQHDFNGTPPASRHRARQDEGVGRIWGFSKTYRKVQ